MFLFLKEDSNDCSNSHFCPNGQICENSYDGPTCRCPAGYEKDRQTNLCIDIDECRRANVCAPGSTCQNTVGSYVCTKTCGIGYVSEQSQCKGKSFSLTFKIIFKLYRSSIINFINGHRCQRVHQGKPQLRQWHEMRKLSGLVQMHPREALRHPRLGERVHPGMRGH